MSMKAYSILPPYAECHPSAHYLILSYYRAQEAARLSPYLQPVQHHDSRAWQKTQLSCCCCSGVSPLSVATTHQRTFLHHACFFCFPTRISATAPDSKRHAHPPIPFHLSTSRRALAQLHSASSPPFLSRTGVSHAKIGFRI
jgi:hypothetical protein